MHRFANPTRFFRIANAVLPFLAVLTIGLFAVGLYFALVNSPADYQQGETVRIMYVHVPAAWAALACYAAMAMAGVSFLIWKHILADLAARAAAPPATCSVVVIPPAIICARNAHQSASTSGASSSPDGDAAALRRARRAGGATRASAAGVRPLASTSVVSAPALSRSSMHRSSPLAAAQCSGTRSPSTSR